VADDNATRRGDNSKVTLTINGKTLNLGKLTLGGALQVQRDLRDAVSDLNAFIAKEQTRAMKEFGVNFSGGAFTTGGQRTTAKPASASKGRTMSDEQKQKLREKQLAIHAAKKAAAAGNAPPVGRILNEPASVANDTQAPRLVPPGTHEVAR
jgi:hypothetical protein